MNFVFRSMKDVKKFRFTKNELFANPNYFIIKSKVRLQAKAYLRNIISPKIHHNKLKVNIDRGETKALRWVCPVCKLNNWRFKPEKKYVLWVDKCSGGSCSRYVIVTMESFSFDPVT